MTQNEPDITKIATLEDVEPLTREMIEAGVFYGRTKRKTNPKMKQYITANRNGIEIIDLRVTEEGLNKALAFLKEKAKSGAPMLFVATQAPAYEDIMSLAKEFSIPAVTTRWLGGTLTNFKVISKRIEYFKKLKADLAAGAFHKYTKKEQLDIEKESSRLEELLGTLENMTLRPEVLIVIDTNLHHTGVREARKLGIPVAAFINTDADPDLVQYPVIGNNKSRSAIKWFLEKAAEALREGRKEKAASLAAVAVAAVESQKAEEKNK